MLSGSYFGFKRFSLTFVPWLAAIAAAEGRVFLIVGDRALDRFALVSKIVGDRPGKSGVGEFVRRIGKGRPVATGQLVLSLRASLDAAQSARQREVDRLIIADLEMQKRPEF